MIGIRFKNNLNQVVDYVNTMPLDIEQIISNAAQESIHDLQTELYELLGGGQGDVVIDFNYSNGQYTLSVDGINQYQMFNYNGMTMDDVTNFIEDKILFNINEAIKNGGY